MKADVEFQLRVTNTFADIDEASWTRLSETRRRRNIAL